MPERSFGRTVRYRRTKLGISQARLGQLIGRSPATIRSWEADKSLPNDPHVIPVLAAVIGIDAKSLYLKAGIEPPVVEETSPTIEEALASLAPETPDALEPSPYQSLAEELQAYEETPGADIAPVESQGLFATIDEAEEAELARLDPANDADGDQSDQSARAPKHVEPTPSVADGPADPGGEEPTEMLAEPAPRTVRKAEPIVARRLHPSPEATVPAAAVAPQAILVSTEQSYIENRVEKQIYQFRTLATVVGLVVLGIAFLWALREGFGAFTDWWDEFFDNLRI